MTATLSAESSAIAICTEGALLADRGDHAGAISCYRRAVDSAPSVLDVHLVLANALMLAGLPLDARIALRTALRVALRPHATADYTLGKALVDAGAGADAVPCFQRARAEFPRDAAAAAALAASLRDAQRPDEAWPEIQAALRMAPADPVALLTAAQIRHDLSDFSGALKWCDRSLQARPDSPNARVTRGYLRHLTGDADGGWIDFEARATPVSNTSAQRWRGEPLDGKSLLVLGEQGVGDQFQFLRFVRHARVRAASRVVIACQSDAVSLLRAAGYDAIARDATIATDLYVPMLSLPKVLDVGAEWVGGASPYIDVPDALAARTDGEALRVGIVWAGNPAHRNDVARSIPPALLHGLLHTHPELRFICMQHGVSDADRPSGMVGSAPSGDWLGTARDLGRLDLLITVDTGIAHLAGAMGVPVWTMIPRVPDWRWDVEGSGTPWYDSMRLFRQPARGDWARVITNVSAALSVATIGV